MARLRVRLYEYDGVMELDYSDFEYVIPEGSFPTFVRIVDRAIQMAIESTALSLGAKRTPELATPLKLAESVGLKRPAPHFDEPLAPGPGTEFQRMSILGEPNGLWDKVRRVEAGPEDGIYEVLSKSNRLVYIKHTGSMWQQVEY